MASAAKAATWQMDGREMPGTQKKFPVAGDAVTGNIAVVVRTTAPRHLMNLT